MVKQYTKEFKEEAARLVIEQGHTQSEVARSLGINAKNVNRWVREITATTGNKKLLPPTEQEELNRLRKENNRLKLEKEILKKAAAFFANDRI
jgi:transposase